MVKHGEFPTGYTRVRGLCGLTVECSLAMQKVAGSTSNFESQPVRFQVTALGKLLTRMCFCHQAV